MFCHQVDAELRGHCQILVLICVIINKMLKRIEKLHFEKYLCVTRVMLVIQ